MINKKELNQEIELIKLTPGSTSNNWSVEAATNENQYKTDNIVLTIKDALDHWNGEKENPAVQKYIESKTEFYCTEYFYYNRLELINQDLKVYLTDNWRHDDILENIRIELNPDYNPLLELLPMDAQDYFKNYDYNPYYYDIGDEALDFLTYNVLETLEDQDIKDTITSREILNIIGSMDQGRQAVIKTADYNGLLDDIKTAYETLIKNIKTEILEELPDKYYDNVYYPAEEAAYNDLLDQLPAYIKDL